MTGNKKLKLGWLFPYSGIFRQLKTDLQQGFDAAMEKEGADFTIQTFPEFIQTGSFQDVEKALNKLILFEQVDLIIGVLSSKVTIAIMPLLERDRTPFLLLNLGADIPVTALTSDLLFYNSLHLWKSEWAIGKWAQEKYGGEPSVNVSVYEGGYGLSEAFKIGTGAGGATTIKLNIVKNFSPSPDISPLVQYIADQKPKHAHILLSGKEGELFLELFREKGLGSATQLTVNPFMVEDGFLTHIPDDIDLYNAITWSACLDTPCNKAFMSLYERMHDSIPTVFSLLAYEAGLAVVAAMRNIPGKPSRESLTKTLGLVHPRGPRGDISLSTQPILSDLPVYLRKPGSSALSPTPVNTILETLSGIEWNDPSMPVENIYSSGWQNPYACV